MVPGALQLRDRFFTHTPVRHRRPFGHKARSPQVRTHSFAARPQRSTMPTFGHQCFPGIQHKLGAAHALEIPYKFDLVQSPSKSVNAAGHSANMMAISDPEGIKTAHNMSEMWSTFARTGHPGAKGQPIWPADTTEKRATMEIDAQCTVVARCRADLSPAGDRRVPPIAFVEDCDVDNELVIACPFGELPVGYASRCN